MKVYIIQDLAPLEYSFNSALFTSKFHRTAAFNSRQENSLSVLAYFTIKPKDEVFIDLVFNGPQNVE